MNKKFFFTVCSIIGVPAPRPSAADIMSDTAGENLFRGGFVYIKPGQTQNVTVVNQGTGATLPSATAITNTTTKTATNFISFFITHP